MLCLSKLPERLAFHPGSDWTFSTSSGKTFEGLLPPSKGGKLQHLGAFVVGIIIGFLGGLFGKGGSAIATPLLSLLGYPGFIAVASPLPATIPGTLVASGEYWQSRLLDWQIVWWSIGVGIPATILGSLLTKFTGARPLLIVTGILVLGFGLSFLFSPTRKRIRRIFAASTGGKSSVLLAAPACAHRNRSWNRIRTSGQCRGIPACAGLLPVPQATDQEIVCVLARRVRCTGGARNRRPRLPRTYFVDGHGTRCAWLGSVFLPRRANCDSHEGQQARTDVRTRSHRAGSLLPLSYCECVQ